MTDDKGWFCCDCISYMYNWFDRGIPLVIDGVTMMRWSIGDVLDAWRAGKQVMTQAAFPLSTSDTFVNGAYRCAYHAWLSMQDVA